VWRSLALLFTIVLSVYLTGCTDNNPSKTVREQGVLKVISRNGPTTYYQDRSGPAGFEYELASLFAEYLGVELEMTTVHSIDEIFQALTNNSVHIAAAGLTITEDRKTRFAFSPPYLQIKQYVLYRAGKRKPRSIEDITDSRIIVIANSSHAEILAELEPEYPELIWRNATDVETTDLLEMLLADEIDYAIVDSNEYIANRAFFPRINVAFEIGQPGELAWALPYNENTENLQKELKDFFQVINENGALEQLEERIYSHSEQINKVSSMTFTEAVNQRLSEHRELMQKVAAEYAIDWHLLAAISYQESHWDPHAKSPTGVRGMMMLTLTTAKEMGIKNRLDAEQSLRGGARYFNKILKRIPSDIEEPDRTWFALAAYNVGFGHVEDARIITEQQGGNPDRWSDVAERLPLLQKRRWYKETKHGYARGNEPVTYVQNIRHYYNLLNWFEVAQKRTPPPQEVQQYLPETLQEAIKTL
jgi:membrane-bound lytic murein transglycosylase F